MERVTLSRSVLAVKVPTGTSEKIPRGSEVVVKQSLGGKHTVRLVETPHLFQIDNVDSDAIGKEPSVLGPASDLESLDTEEQAWRQLRTCFDPEIPINIVDLGLVYELRLEQHADGTSWAHVKMTVTAPGCGMAKQIAADAREKLLMLEGVSEADFTIVWDPPWRPEMMAPGAKEMLDSMRADHNLPQIQSE